MNGPYRDAIVELLIQQRDGYASQLAAIRDLATEHEHGTIPAAAIRELAGPDPRLLSDPNEKMRP